MKKSLIPKLGAGVLIAVLLCLGITILTKMRCQMGPSDEKLISTTMANWKAALIAQDLDKIMEAYSENYESAEGNDKEATREFMERIIDKRYLDDIEVDLENAKTTIEGDKAQFSAVIITGRREPRTTEFTLQKENGTWRIISSKRERRRSEDAD